MIDLEDRVRRAMSAVADSTVIHASPVPVSRPRRDTGPLVGAYAFLATLAVFTVGMLVTGGERATVASRPDHVQMSTSVPSVNTTASSVPAVSEAPLISVDMATLGLEVVERSVVRGRSCHGTSRRSRCDSGRTSGLELCHMDRVRGATGLRARRRADRRGRIGSLRERRGDSTRGVTPPALPGLPSQATQLGTVGGS